MMTRIVDGTALYHDAIRRIQQLEILNATLAAQIDQQAKVVDAAVAWRLSEGAPVRAIILSEKVDEYQRAMAQLAKEGG